MGGPASAIPVLKFRGGRDFPRIVLRIGNHVTRMASRLGESARVIRLVRQSRGDPIPFFLVRTLVVDICLVTRPIFGIGDRIGLVREREPWVIEHSGLEPIRGSLDVLFQVKSQPHPVVIDRRRQRQGIKFQSVKRNYRGTSCDGAFCEKAPSGQQT